MAIKNPDINHPWIHDIRNKLINNPGRTEFCWVPAHINITGNEKADKLAKKGAAELGTTNINTPYDDYKKLVRLHARLNWENSWRNYTGKLREIKYDTIEWHQGK